MKKISIANPVFNGNEKKYLNECIDTGWISANGRFINEFEKKFAEFCGVKYALAGMNGTVTLHLILEALGIGEGDEVIMPALTYIATANATKYCGAIPVFIDSEDNTWNMDPEKIEAAITEKTKVIMVVHLYGVSAEMEAINILAKKHNLIVVEDAAEAHGALYHGEKVGSMSKAGSFSFFGNKIITCGEGGMITTNDKDLYEKMKNLRSQGVDPNKRYWHNVIGYNYRMTNMQAAVGLAQLENIDWHLAERERIKELYEKHLPKIAEYVTIQGIPKDSTHVYWMYSIQLKENVSLTRDEVMEKMEEKNIEMRPVFYLINEMPPYKDDSLSFPVAKKISSRSINLPTHALLEDEDIKYIVDSLYDIINK